MRKLNEVDEAKALMTEAVNWSVMRWLTEKKRVRKAADKANEALWALQKEVKASWPDDLRAAYAALEQDPANPESDKTSNADFQVKTLAKRVKEADDEAYRAHMDAEQTFDLAERRLSTALAREGCHKAINSWELYEKAIHKAEAGIRSPNAASN